MSDWECRLLPIMPVFAWFFVALVLIRGFWMNHQCCHMGLEAKQQLHVAFRGGAGGAHVTERKRQLTNLVSKLVNIIEKISENVEDEVDDQSDNHQSMFLREFSCLISQWESTTPSCGELQQALAKLLSQDVVHQERQQRSSAPSGQSFYQQFLKEKQEKVQETRHNKSFGGKGQGKTKPGAKGKGLAVPRFDLTRICPQKNIIAWQRLESLLEKGETGTDASLNNGVCILDSYYRLLELQNMAEAHGVKLKTLLICPIDNEQVDNDDGGKCEMLPFLGNLALMRARVCLHRSAPSFSGVTPLKSEAPDLSDEEMTSLRIIAPLSLIDDPMTKDYLLKHPELTLRLLKCPLKEVKTNGWNGTKGTIEGYLTIPSSQVEAVLGLSGTGGIFVQRLRKDVLQLPEVNWIPQENKENDLTYFKRVSAIACAASLPFTYRAGGGAWLGIVDPSASSKLKSWAVNGIPDTWGPKPVLQWLQSVKWDVHGQPSPPKMGKQVWQIHAKPPDNDCREKYAFELQIGGNSRNILIKRWQKHHQVENGARLTGPKWWSADFTDDPIELFESQAAIPPTVLEDTQMESSGAATGEPGKSKAEQPTGELLRRKGPRLGRSHPQPLQSGRLLEAKEAQGLILLLRR